MKVKKSLMSLLLLISCMFAFSACSKEDTTCLNFDENSTVTLTYSCVDEEKNFEAELNAEQSRDLILALNKITYVEVKEHIDFGPSYDCLRMAIGNDNLALYDVWYKINYGGYFYFNGKFCETKEKFKFLGSYMNEYSPDYISNSVSFGVQYVRPGVATEDNCQIIKSVSELNDYIAAKTQNTDLPDYVLFRDEVISKYNDEYFKNSFIVIVMKAVSSGSFDFRINDVLISKDRLIINYEISLPAGEDAATCDMAYWYSFVELSNEYSTINNVDLIGLE
ncbi:MAG: hypothetical protein K2M89_05280 [Clostridiales bacterium]|nr:hypothetical protein [Clostridiales bacterium]